MKVSIPLYNKILKVVSFFSKQLKFDKFENKLGRKLALKINEAISLAIFKQNNNIATKKSLHKIFNLKKICSYKTLVVSLNRWTKLAGAILFLILKINRRNQHIVKHIDSTDIPGTDILLTISTLYWLIKLFSCKWTKFWKKTYHNLFFFQKPDCSGWFGFV